jgi:hypothetical protein
MRNLCARNSGWSKINCLCSSVGQRFDSCQRAYSSQLLLVRSNGWWLSRQSKRLSPLRMWVGFSLRAYVKRVSQRSAESCVFSPGAPVSSRSESLQGGLGYLNIVGKIRSQLLYLKVIRAR